VFPNRESQPWREHDWLNWNRRVWTPAARKVGVSEPPYTLRHSYASLRIREDASIPELAEELGHSPQMTLNTYLALFVALGGTSVAALRIGSEDIRDNSVRSRDLRNNDVRSRDVRNGTLSGRDFGHNRLGGGAIREFSLGIGSPGAPPAR
jgi:hypothetical protein